jgi:hypothetical protein
VSVSAVFAFVLSFIIALIIHKTIGLRVTGGGRVHRPGPGPARRARLPPRGRHVPRRQRHLGRSPRRARNRGGPLSHGCGLVTDTRRARVRVITRSARPRRGSAT